MTTKKVLTAFVVVATAGVLIGLVGDVLEGGMTPFDWLIDICGLLCCIVLYGVVRSIRE